MPIRLRFTPIAAQLQETLARSLDGMLRSSAAILYRVFVAITTNFFFLARPNSDSNSMLERERDWSQVDSYEGVVRCVHIQVTWLLRKALNR